MDLVIPNPNPIDIRQSNLAVCIQMYFKRLYVEMQMFIKTSKKTLTFLSWNHITRDRSCLAVLSDVKTAGICVILSNTKGKDILSI